MAVVLVPKGRIPLSVNAQPLAGVEKVQVNTQTPKTFRAGPGFTDYTSGRPQTSITLTFAVFAQQQEFDQAVAGIPEIDGVRRFDCTYVLGTTRYLLKRCQVQTETEDGDEIAGNASLTRNQIGRAHV